MYLPCFVQGKRKRFRKCVLGVVVRGRSGSAEWVMLLKVLINVLFSLSLALLVRLDLD